VRHADFGIYGWAKKAKRTPPVRDRAVRQPDLGRKRTEKWQSPEKLDFPRKNAGPNRKWTGPILKWTGPHEEWTGPFWGGRGPI
jgi:hypothetical protein